MEKGYTKQVCIMFTYDDKGKIKPESKLTGVSFFTPEGNRSRLDGKPFAKGTTYENMTDNQKAAFDDMIKTYEALKDEV